jgi:asparagine synthase (glutamine-hydrolysing)
MSAIAGFWSFAREGAAGAPLVKLLQSQTRYGSGGFDWIERGRYACGRCLNRLLPEDEHDRQPLTCPDDRFFLVADIRIDNREDLAGALGSGLALSRTSDSELLLRAWTTWGEKVLNRIIGDFAFALFDSRDEILFLARDTAGERPLHYTRRDGAFAFSSMPQALAALPGEGKRVNERKLAEFVSDLADEGDESFFEGVKRLKPRCLLRVSRRDLTVHQYWQPSFQELKLPRIEDYGEAMREQLDRAVGRRLRRATGDIASHLSSGFDSSAVTTSAAIQLADAGQPLLAFTAAPAGGSRVKAPARLFADESEIARATARLHPNISHEVLRPHANPLDNFGWSHELAGRPVGSTFNHLWWQAINERARERGASVMLTGEMGNFTISAGRGLGVLADLVRRLQWRRWRREAACLAAGGYSWLNVANASFGGFLPAAAYRFLRGGQTSWSSTPATAELLSSRWHPHAIRLFRQGGWDSRPPRDSREARWRLLQLADPGCFRKMALARWGIEERDPTADRQLVEFCFSLPPEALLCQGVDRPVLRAALGSRVAEDVLAEPNRGYQSADWYRLISPSQIREFLAATGESDPVVDLDSVRAAIDAWPQSDWEDRQIIYRFSRSLMRSLAALDFRRRTDAESLRLTR